MRFCEITRSDYQFVKGDNGEKGRVLVELLGYLYPVGAGEGLWRGWDPLGRPSPEIPNLLNVILTPGNRVIV